MSFVYRFPSLHHASIRNLQYMYPRVRPISQSTLSLGSAWMILSDFKKKSLNSSRQVATLPHYSNSIITKSGFSLHPTGRLAPSTRFGVRQTVSSRNSLSSPNILACSSRFAQPLSMLPPPHLTWACGTFGSAVRASILVLSEQHHIPVWILSTGSGLLLNSGQ